MSLARMTNWTSCDVESGSLVGFLVLASRMFALPELKVALSSPIGFAFVFALRQANYKGTMLLVVLAVGLPAMIDGNAAAAHETFACDRDRELRNATKAQHGFNGKSVWSKQIGLETRLLTFGSNTHVDRYAQLAHKSAPTNSALLTCTTIRVLAFINLGSISHGLTVLGSIYDAAWGRQTWTGPVALVQS